MSRDKIEIAADDCVGFLGGLSITTEDHDQMLERIETLHNAASATQVALDEIRSALIQATEAENFEAIFGDGSLLTGMSPKDIYELGYANFYLAFQRQMYPNAVDSLAEAVKDARGRNQVKWA